MADTPTYWDYLRLPQLLDIQAGLGDDPAAIGHDELHFIIVHQAYELWFKLAISQLRLARDELARPTVDEETIPHVVHHLRRVIEIMRLCVDQFAVMETLTPQDFLDFRDKLMPSSGFQSFQMREFEILLGLEDMMRVTYGKVHPLEHIQKLAEGSPGGALAWGTISRARTEVNLRAALHAWLYRTPIQGSSPEDEGDEEVVQAFLQEYLDKGRERRKLQLARLIEVSADAAEGLNARFAAQEVANEEWLMTEDPRLRRTRAAALFIESYRRLPLLAWPRLLLDTAVELEEQVVLFRTRHARMVERLIGRRVGTGGSSGVDYLDQTTKYRIFTELWAVRSMLSPRAALPTLQNPERYGFREV
jgi:tryptophan 2,3-dioxygenase